MISREEFLKDKQGAKFRDVVEDQRISFNLVLDFFNNKVRRLRLADSVIHHDRPALAGVVKEFELQEQVSEFFENNDGHTTTRFRQGIGVLVRMHMEQMGFSKTGIKGSLGTRPKISPHTTFPGAYKNKQGLSMWFTRAEKYAKLD